MKRILLCSLAAILALSCCAQGPTMGWSSWNTFGINISDRIIMRQADAMKSKGLLDAGYNHINIDDGYFGGRNLQTGELLIHGERFPDGLKPVVDYIHGLGMKAGIYSDAGRNTCGHYYQNDTIAHDVGLYGYDHHDCEFFFNTLGFDFIKVDFCGGNPQGNVDRLELDVEQRYTEIADAIAQTGRDDVRLNVCRWDYPGNWVHDVAASWRTTGDIYAAWESIRGIIGQNLYLSAYCYDGHYNDMDMLEVGRGIGTEEDKTHFGMWCIMCSPLLIGCDMTSLSASTLGLLTNEELIALNQDALHQQAYVVKQDGGTYVLVKDILEWNGPTRAVAFYNPTDEARDMSIAFDAIDLGGQVLVRDLFSHTDLGVLTGHLGIRVPAHATRIYTLTADTRYERNFYEGECGYLGCYQELLNHVSAETAIYEPCEAASGGMVAGWLGRKAANDVQWRNVYSENGGDYELTIAYVSGENRDMTLDVNGSVVHTFTGCNSGGWNRVATASLGISLLPGNNIIRLFHSSAWMPSIDCISLHKAGADHRPTVGIKSIVASDAAAQSATVCYDLGGLPVSETRKGLHIRQGKKILQAGYGGQGDVRMLP